jgi:hypothetical protein
MGGMVLPGSAINEAYDDCLPVRGPFKFDFSENGWSAGSNLVIAAHADIGELERHEECVTVVEGPYGPSVVTDFKQGVRKDGSEVLEIRTDPDAVLIWDDVQLPDAFFSLGLFGTELPGGWIEVEFDKPITNLEGDDVLIVEDTWGDYVLEAAKVYASIDGINWVLLGVADNVMRDPTHEWQTVSYFDLGPLDNVPYIRVVDVTPYDSMPPD